MNLLMLGGSNTGKSTFLVQLYGRIRAHEGRLVARGAPSDISPIRAGLSRLSEGVALEHTQQSTESVQYLPARSAGDGGDIDFHIPEYAGETLDDIVRTRRVTDRWRELVNVSDEWLLFIRLERFAGAPQLLNKPIADLVLEPGTADATRATASHNSSSGSGEPTAALGEVGVLPMDMHIVELLQVLLHQRSNQRRAPVSQPYLTVLLSCWDELGLDTSTSPKEVAHDRIPLVHDFAISVWEPPALTFLGLSAQGRELSKDSPDEDFIERGPQRHGYIVTPDGAHDTDLTRVVRLP